MSPPSGGVIAKAFLSVLADPSVSWRGESAQRFIDKVASEAGKIAATETDSAGEPVAVAWMAPDGRVIPAITKARAECDHRAHKSATRIYSIALYTAADYDALLAERDSWHEAACEMAKREAATRARAEAAEAKVSRAAASLKFALDDRVNGQITYAGVSAINNAFAALNEGDGE